MNFLLLTAKESQNRPIQPEINLLDLKKLLISAVYCYDKSPFGGKRSST